MFYNKPVQKDIYKYKRDRKGENIKYALLLEKKKIFFIDEYEEDNLYCKKFS